MTGVGIALADKYLERLPYRVWVLRGDSELAEGSTWEALDRSLLGVKGSQVQILSSRQAEGRNLTPRGSALLHV